MLFNTLRQVMAGFIYMVLRSVTKLNWSKNDQFCILLDTWGCEVIHCLGEVDDAYAGGLSALSSLFARISVISSKNWPV